MSQPTIQSPLLTELEASAYLRISITKLRRLRKKKNGPKPTTIGRSIFYRQRELDAFIENHSAEAV
jgi:hypothetical protein